MDKRHEPEAPPVRPRPTVIDDVGGLSRNHSDIFFAAVETTRMPMIVTDPRQDDNPIVFANRAFRQMTGYTQDELFGANCRFLQGPETDRDTIAEIRDAIAERREVAVEILNYRKNGSTFWNALFISPVYGRDGELLYFFGSQLDVSRRRDAEDALSQARKMEALGQLTGGIAHDFNNLLQIIVGYVDALKARLGPRDDVRTQASLDHISSAAERASALTQQLLAFARKQRLEGRPVNLNTLVASMSELASRTLGGLIAIRRRLAPDLWNCRLDPVQAEVAILNILINARDAMPNGGEVAIETANREVAASDAVALGPLEPGRYVTIAITDTGTGIPAEILARVLDPFFTTKEEGAGTGLGLSMVYGFANQSGGTVRVTSEEGRSTTVRLFFPAIEQPAADVRVERPQRADERAGTETILIVEDREEVADLARSILQNLGYRILVAHDGVRALDLLDDGRDVDLLFSDLIMPGGMNGVVLAREARRRWPRLKVLLTTGYAEASLERSDARGGEFDVINKPYRRAELIRRVRASLDGPTGVG